LSRLGTVASSFVITHPHICFFTDGLYRLHTEIKLTMVANLLVTIGIILVLLEDSPILLASRVGCNSACVRGE
jgi:hypothetical protein